MPRAGLSPTSVVDAAAELADEVGADQLTLALLAQRLGVRLPSLYKHIDGIDALRRHLAVRALDELTTRVTGAAVGRSGADALIAVATAYRDFARSRPGLYPGVLRAPDPVDEAHVAAAARLLQVVLALLAGFGLAGDDAVDAARTVRATLHGFVALEAAGGFGMTQDVDRSFDRAVTGLGRALTAWPVTPVAGGLPTP